jgi:hypothetical protein
VLTTGHLRLNLSLKTSLMLSQIPVLGGKAEPFVVPFLPRVLQHVADKKSLALRNAASETGPALLPCCFTSAFLLLYCCFAAAMMPTRSRRRSATPPAKQVLR